MKPTRKDLLRWRTRQALRIAEVSQATALRALELIDRGLLDDAQFEATLGAHRMAQILDEPPPWRAGSLISPEQAARILGFSNREEL